MNDRTAVIVTSIHAPTVSMQALARGCIDHGFELIVVGDTASPEEFPLHGCNFFDVAAQRASGFAWATECPPRRYARKNFGYLVAIRNGAGLILETDDDNCPQPGFFASRHRQFCGPVLDHADWVNIYRYFHDDLTWPRGLPLDCVHTPLPPFEDVPAMDTDCPIQQGLTDAQPDIDAIYRALFPLPLTFRADRRIALGRGSWCPFNSQNTAWWPDAYPLLYLPAWCSFRMTDIWRSLVAQRIGWENGWRVLFHEPTMSHDRHPHDLLADFADEVPGHLHNRRIAAALSALPLLAGVAHIAENMRRCYGAFVELDVLPPQELALLECWLADLTALTRTTRG